MVKLVIKPKPKAKGLFIIKKKKKPVYTKGIPSDDRIRSELRFEGKYLPFKEWCQAIRQILRPLDQMPYFRAMTSAEFSAYLNAIPTPTMPASGGFPCQCRCNKQRLHWRCGGVMIPNRGGICAGCFMASHMTREEYESRPLIGAICHADTTTALERPGRITFRIKKKVPERDRVQPRGYRPLTIPRSRKSQHGPSR